jgi:predicted component of type VI protein secretion system
MTVKEAIQVILGDRKSYETSLNYAVNYCLAAVYMHDHELAVQCLYILSNITHWRHPQAKEVRAVLKKFSKEN